MKQLAAWVVFAAMTCGWSGSLPGAIGTGESPIGLLETVAPSTGGFTLNAIQTETPFAIQYAGASDGSGVAEVELWYRDASSAWTASGLTSTDANGTFFFAPATGGTCYFQLVVTDSFGNHSELPSGTETTGQVTTSFQPTTSVPNWWVLE